MSSTPARGRGRGRGRTSLTPALASGSNSNESPQASTSNLTTSDSNNNNTGINRRPVGGLLGGSEYVKKNPTVGGGATAAGGGGGAIARKFKPNMVRKQRVVEYDEDDDEGDGDVKMEDFSYNSSSRGRGKGLPGRGRGRVEVEMTASGPMAQGPSGIPKAAPRSIFGGAGVMNAAIRAGAPRASGSGGSGGGGGSSGVRNKSLAKQGAGGQFDDPEEEDPDDSDYDDSDQENNNQNLERAELLDDIGLEDEMAPMNLPKDPSVLRLARERKEERKINRVKREAPVVKAEPLDDDGDSIMMGSTNGGSTPALDRESRANTVDSKDTFIQVEDTKDFKPEIDMKEDFDVEDPSRERLYIFQFPRKFPDLVNSLHVSNLLPKFTSEGIEIKPEPLEGSSTTDGKGIKKKSTPPEWGRAGSRSEMSSRWPTTEGQMGELCIHKSGKISLMVNGDLIYDVLPAAQPTFLQEVAILDHDPSTTPVTPGEDIPPSEPDRSLKIMGQTFKKFIVVPEVSHLLTKIGEQQEKEMVETLKRKNLKKEKK